MFAPIVIQIRQFMGTKEFNQLRGKAIALHSKVITNFCNKVGVASPKRQSYIRLAKENGKKLGLLA
jgi:hypothetical protein